MAPQSENENSILPTVAASVVLGPSATLPDSTPTCRGIDFSKASPDKDMLDQMMEAFMNTGFQATNVGLAIEQIKELRKWRLSDVDWKEGDDPALRPLEVRQRIRARIFLSYTSNQISSGQREVIRFLVQNKMVDTIVTTTGGIEEDIIKCFRPTFMGDFGLDGRELRKKGLNRIGNLVMPNNHYIDFESWLDPLIEQMHREQDEKWAEYSKEMENYQNNGGNEGNGKKPHRFVWTPSKFIRRMGEEMETQKNHEDSVLYWAAKNDIPIFCPALTDGSVGDMLYFHSYKHPGFVLDIAEDIRRINDLAVHSHCTGMIILGGGTPKHHICNANLMREGADYAVYINTGHEFDGSDSGASPDEAVSWGKIRSTAKPVKVTADATLVFPMVVSQTFAKDVEKWKEETKDTVCYIGDLKK